MIALLLLGGAVGKSAQLPLQTWLPDAMAGPTPVSALIHAATMVTAGVYLIARMHDLYELSHVAQFAVAVVGCATLFIAAASALAQNDIKRILAYSTMSQIGYMFMALGVGAWSAAIFHLMTHAFFKALLFLSAGSVILALHHEQDIFKMGGLWRRLPIPFACMVIGSAALAALPLTSGYYSKDAILLTSFGYASGGVWFWGIGAFASFLTALYTVRMIVVAFFGTAKTEAHDHSGINMSGPLLVLAVLSLVGGFIGLAPLAMVLPDGGVEGHHEGALVWVTAAVPIVGLIVGWLLFVRLDFWRSLVDTRLDARLRAFLQRGWAFDVALRRADRQTVRHARADQQERHRRSRLHRHRGAVARAARRARVDAERPDSLVRSQHGRGGRRGAAVRTGGAVILLELILLLLGAGLRRVGERAVESGSAALCLARRARRRRACCCIRSQPAHRPSCTTRAGTPSCASRGFRASASR